MIATGQTFKGLKIVLDGGTFKNCKFDECTLIFGGLLPITLDGCTLAATCKWEFSGAAKETLMFLKAMHAGGAKAMVDATFDAIRSGQLAAVAGRG
jgi:hypothetical protein